MKKMLYKNILDNAKYALLAMLAFAHFVTHHLLIQKLHLTTTLKESARQIHAPMLSLERSSIRNLRQKAEALKTS